MTYFKDMVTVAEENSTTNLMYQILFYTMYHLLVLLTILSEEDYRSVNQLIAQSVLLSYVFENELTFLNI